MQLARRIAVGLGLAVILIANPSAAAEEEEVYRDLIHSDVPLWGTGPEVWPQHFTNGDEFGCTSRIALGDWKLTESEDETSWWRLTNYGVFHCAVVERRSDERDDLKSARWSHSFIIRIGTIGTADRRELWVLQSGTRPGSDYTLLMRTLDKGTIKTFTVLQRRCPAGSVRKGPSLDAWITSYCAINSQGELLALARKMARLPPIGTLQFIEAPSAED